AGVGGGTPLSGNLRLPHRFCQGDEVIGRRRGRGELPLVADQLPPAWGGQAKGVSFTQVVRVRFGERSERTDHRSRIRIYVRQGGYGRRGASIAGTAPACPPWDCLPLAREGRHPLTT